jgi:CheY-like chemotaxis protein
MRQLAIRALNEAGYTTLSAANGDEAVKICGEYAGEIQLLLTDVVMPNMSGRVLSQKIAILRPSIMVLYMSGYTDDAIVHHGVLDPGTPFLGKPFTAADLAHKVRVLLDNKVMDRRTVASMDDMVSDGTKLDIKALRALPPGFLDKMRKAVVAAHYDEIMSLIDSINISFPDLAATFGHMMSLFDYEGLRNIMERAKEEKING